MAKENKENKHFFRDFKAELKKVIWPTPKQVINNTIAVATIVLITAFIVLVLDLIFENANKFGINRIKTVISNTADTTEDNENPELIMDDDYDAYDYIDENNDYVEDGNTNVEE